MHFVAINTPILFCLVPPQATSCTALEMPTSSEILQVILEYLYTDESPTIKGNISGYAQTFDVLSFSWCCWSCTHSKKDKVIGIIIQFLCSAESLNVEFVCNVLVVADQLLITRLKEMCEVIITENCMLFIFSSVLICISLLLLPRNDAPFIHIPIVLYTVPIYSRLPPSVSCQVFEILALETSGFFRFRKNQMALYLWCPS